MRAYTGGWCTGTGEYSVSEWACSGALSKEMQNSVLVQNSLISKHQKMLEAAKQETAGKEQVTERTRSACMRRGWTALYAHGRIGAQAAAQSQSRAGRRGAHAGAHHSRGAKRLCAVHRYTSQAAPGLPFGTRLRIRTSGPPRPHARKRRRVHSVRFAGYDPE